MNFERGKRYALNVLSLRMYTSGEIFDRLIKKGADEETAQSVVSALIKDGILDDRQYAIYYAHDKSRLSGYGAYRIKCELIKKGIAVSIIEDALNSEEIDFKESITEYTKMKFGENIEVSPKEMNRIKGHLARRGYSFGEISDCLSELEITASRSVEY